MALFSKDQKVLRIFALATGAPMSLLIFATLGNDWVKQGIISEPVYYGVISIVLLGFIIALIAYAVDKKKN